jgi:hypothetical protein
VDGSGRFSLSLEENLSSHLLLTVMGEMELGLELSVHAGWGRCLRAGNPEINLHNGLFRWLESRLLDPV